MYSGQSGSQSQSQSQSQGGGRRKKSSPRTKKREWLLRMNRRLGEIPVGELDPAVVPVSAIMNAWAKTRSPEGADMVEMWLRRSLEEADAGNSRPGVVPTTKTFTMAVDAWAKSSEGGKAAQRAEATLQHMYELYRSGRYENLRPTTGIFNAVINAWARSGEKSAPVRAEQVSRNGLAATSLMFPMLCHMHLFHPCALTVIFHLLPFLPPDLGLDGEAASLRRGRGTAG